MMSFFSKRSPDLTETMGSLGTKPLIAQTSADMVSPVLQCWRQYEMSSSAWRHDYELPPTFSFFVFLFLESEHCDLTQQRTSTVCIGV